MPYVMEHPEFTDGRTFVAQTADCKDEWAKSGWTVQSSFDTEYDEPTDSEAPIYPSGDTFPSDMAPTPAPAVTQTDSAKGQE